MRQPATAQIAEHLAGRKVHLLAEPLGDDHHIDEPEQVMGIRAHAAAVERSEHAAIPACLGVVDRRIALVAVDVQRAAALQIERRKRMQIIVVATAHDRALSLLRHDKG